MCRTLTRLSGCVVPAQLAECLVSLSVCVSARACRRLLSRVHHTAVSSPSLTLFFTSCFLPTYLPRRGSRHYSLELHYVLEHLEPHKVDEAVNELTRVARSWLLLKISNRAESMRMDKIEAPVGQKQSDTFARCPAWATVAPR